MTTPRTPRTHVRMFKPQFVRLVEWDLKRETLRPFPKRERDMPQVGDFVDCRAWIGLPYRSKQRKLHAEPRKILEVEHRAICKDYIAFTQDGSCVADRDRLDMLARRDGFNDWPDMRDWFRKEHGLPFKGVLIRWEGKPVSTT